MTDKSMFSLDIVCVCGAVSPVTARFCSSCGRSLTSSTRRALESQPKSQIGSQSESQFGSQPESQFGSQPESQFGSQPESQFGSQPESQIGSQPESQIGSQPESQIGSQPLSQIGSQPESEAVVTPGPIAISTGLAGEERRRVTTLFADLSGFTALAGRLETEDLLAVVDPLIAGLAGVVTRYDGYIEKFAGDALLALFGAPVAHEDDAVRALQVAAEMHVQVAQLSSGSRDSGLALHIGVTTGIVVARSIESGRRTDYAVLGESVILAQRLESLAPPGETYVGESTRQLTGDQFDFEELGPLRVKGRDDPVTVFRVVGRRILSGNRDSARMIGRDRELADLVGALREARSGRTLVAQISGPAGSGKSRLLTELRSDAAAGGVLGIDIVAASYSQPTYSGFAPLFVAALAARYPEEASTGDRLSRLDDDRLAPATAGFTALLLGESGWEQSLGDLAPQSVQRQLFESATNWLIDLSGRRDLLVMIDNLHWLDSSSLDLLAELTSRLTGRPVLFALAGRPPAKPPRDANPSVLVELTSLNIRHIRELIVDELALTPDDRLVAFVHDRSQGNPLMARESLRQLHVEELLDARGGHVRLIAGAETANVPATLRSLLAARIDTLRPQTIELATAAAVIGFLVPPPLLAEVTTQSGDGYQDALAELLDTDFLVHSGRDGLRFDCTPVREVLYARLTGRRRKALHTRVADAVHRTLPPGDASAALLAEHRYLAGDAHGALPWLLRVAKHSRRVFAHDEAVVALTRAVESATIAEPDSVPGLLCDLADVRMELGEYERAGELYVQAQRTGGDARAWAGYPATLRRRGLYAEGQESVYRALSARPTGDARLIWCELSWNLSVSGDLAGSVDAAQQGLALGGGDDGVAGLLLLQMVRAETLLGQLDAAREHVAPAMANLESAGDLPGLCTAYRLLGSLQERAGELEAAAKTLEQGLALAERTGVVEEIGGCQINLGLVKGALGDHHGAADCYARAAITFEQAGHRAGQAMAYGNRSYELLMLGHGQEARTLGHKALALADEVGNHLTSADIHNTLGLIAEAEAEPAEMIAHARSAITEFELAGLPEAAGESREMLARARSQIVDEADGSSKPA